MEVLEFSSCINREVCLAIFKGALCISRRETDDLSIER